MAHLTKEQADVLINIQEKDHPKTKELCFLMCRMDNCDPEVKTSALANNPQALPEGYVYKLWQYRLPKVRAMLRVLKEENVITETAESTSNSST